MRSLSLLILALAVSGAFGCNKNNFLSMAFNLWPDTIDNTQATRDSLNFCGSLKAGGTCCPAAAINDFQNKADNHIAYLEGLAGDRDQVILLRRDYVATRRDSLLRIKEAYDRLERITSTNRTFQGLIDNAKEGYGKLAEALTSNWTELVSNFTEYQKSRATCINKLMITTSAFWCLACSSSPLNTPGIDMRFGVVYTAQYEHQMTAACYPYLQHSALQSNILTAYYYRNYLDQIAASMERLADGNSDQIEAVNKLIENAFVPEHEVTAPAKFPDDCNSAMDCDWMFSCDGMFYLGILSNSTLIRGGNPIGSTPCQSGGGLARRLENNDDSENGRRLADGSWELLAGEIELDIAFSENPGGFENINTGNSAGRTSLIACILTLVASLFL